MLMGRGAIFEGGSRTFLEGKLKQARTWGKYFDGCKDVFVLKIFFFLQIGLSSIFKTGVVLHIAL